MVIISKGAIEGRSNLKGAARMQHCPPVLKARTLCYQH